MIILKIGARTFKTALAVLLAMLLLPLIGLGDSVGLTAAAVIFSMQPSVQETFITTRNRVVANTIGGLIAFLVVNFVADTPVMISLATALLIAILHQLKLDKVIGLSVLTLINVMLFPGANLMLTAFTRVAGTFVGVVIAFMVNTLVLPPKYDIKFYEATTSLTDNSMKYIRSMLRKNAQFPIMAEDLKKLNGELSLVKRFHTYMMDPVYKMFVSSRYYSMLRFLVVSRQSIRANQTLYELANTLHSSESTYNHLPQELRALIRERMETLMTAHEQILLTYPP